MDKPTDHERTAFRRDGVLIRPRAVSPTLVEAARKRVMSWYKQGFDSREVERYTQKTFAPELGDHPDLLAVYEASGPAELANNLMGAPTKPVMTTQVQIRLPNREAQPVKAMHVDGVSCPHLDPRELRTFTLLAGVLLTEVTDAEHRALHYVPGGHLDMSEWFRTTWTQDITDQTPPEINAQSGRPLLGRPGDAFLLHHLVPHAVGPNAKPEPRIVLYFRIHHIDHEHQALPALRDPWLEYPALAGSR